MLAGFYDAVLAYLVRQGVDATAVTDVEQDTVYEGCCETCEYSYVVVDITYIDAEGSSYTHRYTGDMGDLIREL